MGYDLFSLPNFEFHVPDVLFERELRQNHHHLEQWD